MPRNVSHQLYTTFDEPEYKVIYIVSLNENKRNISNTYQEMCHVSYILHLMNPIIKQRYTKNILLFIRWNTNSKSS